MYKVRGAVRDCKAKSPRDVMLVRMRPHDFHRDAPAGAVLGLRLLQRRVLVPLIKIPAPERPREHALLHSPNPLGLLRVDDSLRKLMQLN